MTATEFWAWFLKDVATIKRPDPKILAERVTVELRKIHPEIGAEIAIDDREREIVLTAYGVRSLFGLIREIAAAAPQVTGWQVTALKRPNGFEFVFESGRVSLEASKVPFVPFGVKSEPDVLVIRLFFPVSKYHKMDWDDIGVTILTAGLGEELFSQISCVEAADLGIAPKNPLLLRDLPDFLRTRS